MKRLYSLMLSAVVAIAASAAAPKAATEVVSPLLGGLKFQAQIEQAELSQLIAPKPAVMTKSLKNCAIKNKISNVSSLKRVAKLPRKAEGEEGSKWDGYYTMTIGDYYHGDNSQGPVDIEVLMLVEDGIFMMAETTDEWFVDYVEGPFDETTGTATFEPFYITEVDYEGTSDAVSFCPTKWNEAASTVDFTSFAISFDDESESFVFPSDGDYGFCWPCWNSGKGESYLQDAQAFNKAAATYDGYYGLFDTLAMVKVTEGGDEPDPEETWVSLGMGEWYEGLLNVFYTDVEDGWHWPVEIFESSITPGRYKLYPYAVESPFSKLLGGRMDDECQVIVDATDPNQVYITDAFSPYKLKTFASVTLFSVSTFGSLENSIISFPSKAFAYQGQDENGDTTWYFVNGGGDFKIALPGAVVKDYTLKATTEHACSDQPTTTVNLTIGADIAKTFMMVYNGDVDASYGNNASIVAASGQEIPVGTSVTFNTPIERGHYSVMFAAVNADNEVVAAATTYQIVDGENDQDWQVVPETTTKFTEGFLAGMFSDIDACELDVELEENVNTPGRFRFEAPYANHPNSNYLTMVDHSADHKHYVYVNAVDPDAVFVEPSSLGFTMNGFGALYVHNHRNTGTYKDNVIEAPAYISTNNTSTNYSGGSIKLVMTKTATGIKEISSVEANKVIYDVQGRRVANPTRGLYIVNGKKAFVK